MRSKKYYSYKNSVAPRLLRKGEFVCNKFTDLYNIIIPILKKYPIQGEKGKDFLDWCKIAEIMNDGDHLTPAGLDKIREIKEAGSVGSASNE